MGFAWVFYPFFRRFKKNMGENGDGDRKSGRGCIPLQAWSQLFLKTIF
jgi:hypothetical protein